MFPGPLGIIMSVFSLHILALAGIEILIGLTVVGTLLATIGFFIGDLREKKASGTQLKKSSAEEKDIKVLGPKITPTVKKSEVEANKGVPEKIGNEASEPVMAILQKSDSRDKPALPKMPKVGGASDLPPLPGGSKPVDGEELGRQIVEKQLQRIADKRAEHKQDESEQGKPDELPAFLTPPKVGGEKPVVSPIPKPFLHELPQPGGEKPALKPLPKQGGDLPPMPDSAKVQEEVDLQTHDEERDA